MNSAEPALPAASDAASARALVQRIAARLDAHGMADFRAPPPEPTTCCGRGCTGCVWLSYLAAFAWWCEEAGARLEKPRPTSSGAAARGQRLGRPVSHPTPPVPSPVPSPEPSPAHMLQAPQSEG